MRTRSAPKRGWPGSAGGFMRWTSDAACARGAYTTQRANSIVSKLPEQLDGKTLLDIGAWDGFYSFECARRGADVTSMDIWHPGHNETSEGYAVARAALGMQTKAVRASVFELEPEKHGVHDIVLFLGVLYHLEDPLGAVRATTQRNQGTTYPRNRMRPCLRASACSRVLPRSRTRPRQQQLVVAQMDRL